jgi:hypothetical protein
LYRPATKARADFVLLKDIKIYGFVALFAHTKKDYVAVADVYVENIGETN